MVKKQKAASDVATIESGMDDLYSLRREENAHGNCIIGAGAGQGPISRLLMHGAENAQHKREIMELAGITSERQFLKLVEAERKRGTLILSTREHGGGWFLPDEGTKGRAEIERHRATLVSQAVSMLRTAEAERMALNVLQGQEVIGP